MVSKKAKKPVAKKKIVSVPQSKVVATAIGIAKRAQAPRPRIGKPMPMSSSMSMLMPKGK